MVIKHRRSAHLRSSNPGDRITERFELQLTKRQMRWLREQTLVRHQSMAGIVASAIEMLMAVTPPVPKRVRDLR